MRLKTLRARDEVEPHDFGSGEETHYCLVTALRYDAVGGRLRQEVYHGRYSGSRFSLWPICPWSWGYYSVWRSPRLSTISSRPAPRICCCVDVGPSSSSKSVSIYAHKSSSSRATKVRPRHQRPRWGLVCSRRDGAHTARHD